MKIYLDVCCLNRPFDDQTQDRIRLESESILTILSYCLGGKWRMVGSEVGDIEISMIPNSERKRMVTILSTIARSKITVDKKTETRAIEFENLGFKPFDALHIACAEKARADVLLTTDDGLLRMALRNNTKLKVIVKNPVEWQMEVIKK